jgi:hypothetical protein
MSGKAYDAGTDFWGATDELPRQGRIGVEVLAPADADWLYHHLRVSGAPVTVAAFKAGQTEVSRHRSTAPKPSAVTNVAAQSWIQPSSALPQRSAP